MLELDRPRLPVSHCFRGQEMRTLLYAEIQYSGVTLNVARPDMKNYATLGVMLYKGIGASKGFAL